MTGRRLAVLILIVISGGVFPLVRASGAVLPDSIRTTTNAAAVADQVKAFYAPIAPNLISEDPADRAKARDAIVAEVQSAGAPAIEPSAAFLDVYTDQLNAILLPIAQHENVHIRLNAAVIAARVAEKANNARLAPTIAAFLADKNEAMVLWGVKGSKFLVAPILSNPAIAKTDKLIPALLDAAKQYASNGPIIQSVYEALIYEKVRTAISAPPEWAAIAAPTVNALHAVLGIRAELYKQGMPAMPLAETTATTFLTSKVVWNSQTPDQKLQTAQYCSDLIGLSSMRLQDAAGNDRHDLVETVKRIAQGLTVAGGWMGKGSEMDAAVKTLTNIGASTSAADVLARSQTVFPKLRTIPEFAKLNAPPNVQ